MKATIIFALLIASVACQEVEDFTLGDLSNFANTVGQVANIVNGVANELNGGRYEVEDIKMSSVFRRNNASAEVEDFTLGDLGNFANSVGQVAGAVNGIANVLNGGRYEVEDLRLLPNFTVPRLPNFTVPRRSNFTLKGALRRNHSKNDYKNSGAEIKDFTLGDLSNFANTVGQVANIVNGVANGLNGGRYEVEDFTLGDLGNFANSVGQVAGAVNGIANVLNGGRYEVEDLRILPNSTAPRPACDMPPPRINSTKPDLKSLPIIISRNDVGAETEDFTLNDLGNFANTVGQVAGAVNGIANVLNGGRN